MFECRAFQKVGEYGETQFATCVGVRRSGDWFIMHGVATAPAGNASSAVLVRTDHSDTSFNNLAAFQVKYVCTRGVLMKVMHRRAPGLLSMQWQIIGVGRRRSDSF